MSSDNNNTDISSFIGKVWDSSIIPTLQDYIRIQNQSPAWDKEWRKTGHTMKAVELLKNWVLSMNVPTLKLEVIDEEDRTPLIFITVDATEDNKNKEYSYFVSAWINYYSTVLMYGHLDKQPPLTEEWKKPYSPYEPVIEDDKLYGRGASDDGYSTFCAVCSVLAARSLKGMNHSKIVILIESCEESGSVDLEYYTKKLKPQIGNVGLVICLDSGCGNYQQFWLTNSLRGIADGTLKVKVLKEGVHSGDASGIVPDSFRICRNLLDRIEDSKTGEVLLKEAYGDIDPKVLQQVEEAAKYLDDIASKFPFVDGMKPSADTAKQLILNRTWKPQLTVIGANGLPACEVAGNVLRSETQLQLSLRLPPNVDAAKAEQALKEVLEANPPYNAQIEFKSGGDPCNGWVAPTLHEWLEKSINNASNTFYGKPAAAFGEGGSIPFMSLLHSVWPQAQFVITGVLGPGSNAHGPNEFLHIPFAKKLTCCISQILSDFSALSN